MAGKANAQIDSIDILGPEDHPFGSDVVTRKGGHAHGLAGRPGEHRSQEAAVNAGHKIPHKLAHAKAGGRDSKGNQSSQADARAQRNIHKTSKPLPDLGR